MKTKSPNARRLENAIKSANHLIDQCEQEIIACEETMKGFLKDEDKEVYRKQIEYYQDKIKESKDDIVRMQEELSNETEIEVNDEFFQEQWEKMNGMSKWDVNRMLDEDSKQIPYDNGYFGGYTLITFCGRQAIVYVDDRDAKVIFKTPFYDKIFYGANPDMRWSGDKRYSDHSASIIICHNGLYNMIKERNNGEPICPKWYKHISTQKERYMGSNSQSVNIKYGYTAIDQNDEVVFISANGGYPIKDNSVELERVRKMSREEILEKWIKAGGLVVGGSGWQYRGAGTAVIPNDKAAAEFHKYSFGKGFNELEWVEYNGEVALSMREYSELDME